MPADYRKPQFIVAGTTHIGPYLTADHFVILGQTNDGFTARSPGLTPDKAKQLGQMLIDAGEQACQLAAEARAAPIDKAA